MKKMLSLLASLGLVATSSMAVVACTKQDAIPTYKGLDSLSNIYLTSDNEALPFKYLSDDGKPNDEDLILGTLATRFTKPADTLTKMKSELNIVKTEVIPTSKIYKDKETGKVTTEASDDSDLVSAIYTVLISKDNQATTIQIKGTNNADVLTDGNAIAIKFDTEINGQKEYLNKLISTFNSVSSIVKNKPNDKIKDDEYKTMLATGTELGNLDQWLLTVGTSFQTLLVGKDDTTGVRYSSIEQQIKASFKDENNNKTFIDFNKAIIDQVIAWNAAHPSGTTVDENTRLNGINETEAMNIYSTAAANTIAKDGLGKAIFGGTN